MDLMKMMGSFKFAWKGVVSLFRNENNAKFHLGVSLAVLIGGYLLRVTVLEWILLVICIGLVFAAEAFNTAIEKLCDRFHPEDDKDIGKIKDLSAAGVLFMAAVAVGVGLLIFIPRIIA